jgi:hypothetical protein
MFEANACGAYFAAQTDPKCRRKIVKDYYPFGEFNCVRVEIEGSQLGHKSGDITTHYSGPELEEMCPRLLPRICLSSPSKRFTYAQALVRRLATPRNAGN